MKPLRGSRQKEKPLIYKDFSGVVRLSENSRKNFIGRGRSGIIEEGDPNEVYQSIRQSSDDNGDMNMKPITVIALQRL